MSQHNFTSSVELSPEEANRQHIEGARAFAAAPKNFPPPVNVDTGPRKAVYTPPPVWSNAKYTISPSLHEAMITSIENFDEGDAALAQARNAFSLATETLKKISDTREPLSRDSSKTDEQKLLLMATQSERAQDRCGKAFDNAFKALSRAADDIERQLTAPLEQGTHTDLCKEIRQHIRSLDKDERGKFITEGFARGDKDIINATLGVPSYLVGIHEAQRAALLRQYREAKDPAAVARLALYRKAIERVTSNAPLIFVEFEKAQGGKNKDVRRLRGQVSASEAALAALSGE